MPQNAKNGVRPTQNNRNNGPRLTRNNPNNGETLIEKKQKLRIREPWVIAGNGFSKFIVTKADIGQANPATQIWYDNDGYSDVRPLQIWLKFLYYIEEINPPHPWVEPA